MGEWYPRVLVLGPGGMRGFLELGAIYVLQKEGLLDKVDTYCGVSIGAVIALLLVCGYSIYEIVEHAVSFDLFKDIHHTSLQDVIQLTGLLSNAPTRKKLEDLVIKKLGKVPTLWELYLLRKISLVTVALNITTQKVHYFSPFTDSSTSCVDAVMCSCHIPFLYHKLTYKNNIYVDGALANNYPINYFDDGLTPILGLYIKNDYTNKISISNEELFSSYFHKIIGSLMDQSRNLIISYASPQCKHLELLATSYDTTGFTMDARQKGRMFGLGMTTAKTFLTTINEKDNIVYDKQKYLYPYQ